MLHADLQVFRKSEFGISVEFTDLNLPIMVYLITRNIGVLNRGNFAYLDRWISAYAGASIAYISKNGVSSKMRTLQFWRLFLWGRYCRGYAMFSAVLVF